MTVATPDVAADRVVELSSRMAAAAAPSAVEVLVAAPTFDQAAEAVALAVAP